MSKTIDYSSYSSANSLSDLLAIFSNVDSSSWAAKKGKQYTATELGDYYYDYLSTQDERAYNEYYYNTYESPSAMVAQYQEAGLNPALMYGSGASTTSTNNSTGYSNPNQGQSAQSDNFTRLTEVMQMLMSGASLGSQMKMQGAQAEQAESQARLTAAQANREEQLNANLPLEVAHNAQMMGLEEDALSIKNAMAEGEYRYKTDSEWPRRKIENTIYAEYTSKYDEEMSRRGFNWLMSDERINQMQADYDKEINESTLTKYQANMEAIKVAYEQFSRDQGTWEAMVSKAKSEAKLSDLEANWYTAAMVVELATKGVNTVWNIVESFLPTGVAKKVISTLTTKTNSPFGSSTQTTTTIQ